MAKRRDELTSPASPTPASGRKRIVRGSKREDTGRRGRPHSLVQDTQAACEGHVRQAGAMPHCYADDHVLQQQSPTITKTSTTQRDIKPKIEAMMVDQGGGMDTYLAWRDAAEQPPITPESLSELDMPRIINNPKLRHDVNFDRELHFRPNLDGSKGKEKIKATDQYWIAVGGETFMVGAVQQALQQARNAVEAEHWELVMKKSRKRLPRVFEVVRDVLKTLVPDQDQQKILDRLNVDLIIQQIDHGMCDLAELAAWLAQVLKNHCAPMRDSMVDKMQASITNGWQQADQTLMVTGLRQLLQILEAMKLDVANHQIRHMRPLLVADTVNFQQRYNAHRITLGKLNAESSRVWLWQQYDRFNLTDFTRVDQMHDESVTLLETLARAILQDLLHATNTTYLTNTFYLDIDRLRNLRVDMHSLISHKICGDVLKELVAPQVPKADVPKAVEALQTSLAAIVGVQGRWMEHVENIACEVVRIVLTMENRSPPFDNDLCAHAERRLLEDLATGSATFRKQAQDMFVHLLPKALESVNKHKHMCAVDLQDALVPPLALVSSHAVGFGAILQPAGPAKTADPEDEIIRRFTHLIVLHWQVWADLVYLQPAEDYVEFDEGYSSPPHSPAPMTAPAQHVSKGYSSPPRSPTPMTASAQHVSDAYFPEGHRWPTKALKTVDTGPDTPMSMSPTEHDHDLDQELADADAQDQSTGSVYPANEF